jgi:V/A-type H+/Na+-transporting ATPase subunit D
MMGSIKPTRSELLRTKKRIVLAKKGHELLKKKQDSLVIEFFRLLKEVRTLHLQLQERYASASRQLDQARALESDLRIKAAAIAVRQAAPIEVQLKNIAGVKVPQISRVEQSRDTTSYDSLMLQDVGTAYIGVIELVLQIAAMETALRKILIEIKKTKRRAHALDHILIPELMHTKGYIQFQLEERAREEFTRLKRRKH